MYGVDTMIFFSIYTLHSVMYSQYCKKISTQTRHRTKIYIAYINEYCVWKTMQK